MIQELLRKLPLFQALEEDDLRRLADGARRLSLAPGDTIVSEGEVDEKDDVSASGGPGN